MCFYSFTSQEENKYGIKVDAWEEIITSIQSMELKNVQISGVMGMASFTQGPATNIPRIQRVT